MICLMPINMSNGKESEVELIAEPGVGLYDFYYYIIPCQTE